MIPKKHRRKIVVNNTIYYYSQKRNAGDNLLTVFNSQTGKTHQRVDRDGGGPLEISLIIKEEKW